MAIKIITKPRIQSIAAIRWLLTLLEELLVKTND